MGGDYWVYCLSCGAVYEDQAYDRDILRCSSCGRLIATRDIKSGEAVKWEVP